MRNERGIALMMVISAIMLLSMIVLEFVFSSNINYRIAVNEKERLQAYYLAESAINLMKLELKIDKQIKAAVASSPVAQNLAINLNEPLCKQFPFSTDLIRAFFVGGEIPSLNKGESAPEGEAPPEEMEKGKSVTGFQTETAQEFLAFEGDFSGTCEDEQSKFNLNYFNGADPAQQTLSGLNPYDSYKLTLSNFLKGARFKNLFEETSPEKIDEIVRNIADWADKNDVINDYALMTRGAESSIYKADKTITPLNNKFLSLDEIHLVEGVDDTWFMPLEDMFTVYGENKVNICQAGDDVVWSLITTYASQNPNIPPLDPRNAEAKAKLLRVIQLDCTAAQPQISKIASDLDAALGAVPATTTPGAAPVGFASFITTDPRFYSLKLTGQVNDTMVNIKAVFDIKDPDPKKWKMLYYKVY